MNAYPVRKAPEYRKKGVPAFVDPSRADEYLAKKSIYEEKQNDALRAKQSLRVDRSGYAPTNPVTGTPMGIAHGPYSPRTAAMRTSSQTGSGFGNELRYYAPDRSEAFVRAGTAPQRAEQEVAAGQIQIDAQQQEMKLAAAQAEQEKLRQEAERARMAVETQQVQQQMEQEQRMAPYQEQQAQKTVDSMQSAPPMTPQEEYSAETAKGYRDTAQQLRLAGDYEQAAYYEQQAQQIESQLGLAPESAEGAPPVAPTHYPSSGTMSPARAGRLTESAGAAMDMAGLTPEAIEQVFSDILTDKGYASQESVFKAQNLVSQLEMSLSQIPPEAAEIVKNQIKASPSYASVRNRTSPSFLRKFFHYGPMITSPRWPQARENEQQFNQAVQSLIELVES
jgi:hypothetical protein